MIPVSIRQLSQRFKISDRSFEDFKSRLRIGQVVQGRVVRIIQDHKAFVRLLGYTVVAETSVPLKRGERVTVAVHALDPTVHLRLAPMERAVSPETPNYAGILRSLGIDTDSMNLQLIEQVLRYGLPATGRMLRRLRDRLNTLKKESRTGYREDQLIQCTVLLHALGLPFKRKTLDRVISMMNHPSEESIDYMV